MRGRTKQLMVRSLGEGETHLRPDDVIVEEPMEIRLDGHLVTTTMRTPGHDFELAVGYCHGECLLGGARVRDIRYCATGSAVDTEFNVVTVGTKGEAPEPTARLTVTTSSCGLCGSEAIAELTSRLSPLPPPATPVAAGTLTSVARVVRGLQPLFERTGSTHAAAAFDLETGTISVVREDIGRHNAVDKLVGRLLLDDALPARGSGLFLSGRVSLELVQKAWAAGFPVVVSIGGPSSLAIATAEAASITLVAFLRSGRMNVYAGNVV